MKTEEKLNPFCNVNYDNMIQAAGFYFRVPRDIHDHPVVVET